MLVTETDDRLLIRLFKDEEILESVHELARQRDIPHASVQGIGAVTDVELGFYHLQQKEYERKAFGEEPFELISLLGNLGWADEQPFLHAHVALGRGDYSMVGGHLFRGVVLATCELVLSPGAARLERRFDPEIGLKLWALVPGRD